MKRQDNSLWEVGADDRDSWDVDDWNVDGWDAASEGTGGRLPYRAYFEEEPVRPSRPRRRRTRRSPLPIILAVAAVLVLVLGLGIYGLQDRTAAVPPAAVLQTIPAATVSQAPEATAPPAPAATTPRQPSVTLPPERPVSAESRYFRSLLTAQEQEIYDIFRECIGLHEERSQEVFVSSLEQSDTIVDYVLWDYTEYFWFDSYTRYSVEENGGYTVSIAPNYVYTAQESAAYRQFIDDQIQPTLDDLFAKTDYEKVLGVYCYLIDLFYYDLDYSGTTVYDAFLNRRAVCESYAKATKYMLEKLGIEALYVEGETVGGSDEGHAWNIVKVNGVYYQLDTTWGDPVTEDGRQIMTFDYCLIDDATMMRNHIYDTSLYPACSSMDDHYFVREGRYYDVYDRQALTDMFGRIGAVGERVSFRMANQAAYQQAATALFENDELWEIAKDLGWMDLIQSATRSASDETYVISITYLPN